YDKPLIELLHDNVSKITFWILIVSGAFLVISILLINSSIRLSVYSKRFVIKTMQMVGATKMFIRRPFIWKNIQLGVIGAVLATVALGFVLYYLDAAFPELLLLDQEVLLAGLFIGIFVLGIFISWISTFFATQRFLNLKTDDLFYYSTVDCITMKFFNEPHLQEDHATKEHQTFVFRKANYKWMFVGIGLIVLGYLLMAGRGSDD